MNSKTKIFVTGLILAGTLFIIVKAFDQPVFNLFQKEPQIPEEIAPLAKEIPKKTHYDYPPAAFDLLLINSEGENIDFEDFKGKVIFMNMWATWCAPCVEEMRGINHLYNKIKTDEKIEMVMVSHDENFERAKNFIKKNGYHFEIYKVNGRFPQMYNAGNLPATYIINAAGELVVTHLGMGEYGTKDFHEYLVGLK